MRVSCCSTDAICASNEYRTDGTDFKVETHNRQVVSRCDSDLLLDFVLSAARRRAAERELNRRLLFDRFLIEQLLIAVRRRERVEPELVRAVELASLLLDFIPQQQVGPHRDRCHRGEQI